MVFVSLLLSSPVQVPVCAHLTCLLGSALVQSTYAISHDLGFVEDQNSTLRYTVHSDNIMSWDFLSGGTGA